MSTAPFEVIATGKNGKRANKNPNAFSKQQLGASAAPSLVLLGSPLIDLTVKIDAEFLKSNNLDPDTAYSINDAAPHHRGPNKDLFRAIETKAPTATVGGSVTNTAVTFSKLQQNRNNPLTYFGTIGDDFNGKLIEKQLKLKRVPCRLYKSPQFDTGRVAVLLLDGARTLVTDLGASRHFPREDFDFLAAISKATHVYFSAFFIGVSYGTIERVIQLKPTIIFNLGAPFLALNYPNEMKKLYKSAQVIVGNESEHIAFATANSISRQTLIETIKATRKELGHTSTVIIVTRNKHPVILLTCDNKNVKIDTIPVPQIENSRILSTNGAGDAFIGAFLVRYLQGVPLLACVEFGVQEAAEAIQL